MLPITALSRNLCCYLLLLFPFCSQGQFSPQFGQPSENSLADLAMPDSNICFLTGSNTYSTTNDGGINWYTLGYSGMFTKATFFSSIQFGIVVGNAGKYRTNKDCGYFSSWSSDYYVGVNRDLLDVYFTDDQHGYICGMQGTLVRTVNQGTNWTTVATGTTANLNGVFCTNDTTAFACGDGGKLLKVHRTTIVSSQTLGTANLNKIHFTNALTGYAVGHAGTVYKTTDGGTSWNLLPIPTTVNLLSLDFTSEQHGAITGDGGQIFVTSDAGQTWTAAVTPVTTSVLSIAFKNVLEGNAIGSNFLLRTIDGGVSWQHATGNLQKTHFPSPQVGYAVGATGMILKTTNAGNDWKQINTGPEQNVGVYFLNNDTGYVVGSNVRRTLNGGLSWTNIPVPTTYGLYDVYFSDYNHGTIVGNRTILYTSNAGQTWTASSPTTTVYTDLHFPSPSTGYFCTSTGKVFKSTNGGVSWVPQATPISSSLANIFFLNNTEGWAVGLAGKILHTSNGGTTWTLQTSGVTTTLNGIHFFDAYNGVVVGSAGTYLLTSDGGVTWRNHSLSSSTLDFADLCFTDLDHGYALGGSRVYTLGPFSNYSPPYLLCPGETLQFNSFAPYFNNDQTVTAIFELTDKYGDFSNALLIDTITLDSVGLVQATIPLNFSAGIYKTRLRQVDNPNRTSFVKYIKVLQKPTASFTFTDSMFVATSPQEPVVFNWHYRPQPNYSPSYVGNNDSLRITQTGEYRLLVTYQCCSTLSDWMTVTVCNGALHSAVTTQQAFSICSGDSVIVGTHTYRLAGTYSDTFTAASGCDSVVVTTLTVHPVYNHTFTRAICPGDSLYLQEAYRNTAGTYYDTLTSARGCDSLVTTHLTIRPTYQLTANASICAGDSILLAGQYQKIGGTYTDTLTTVQGCDSILVTILSLRSAYALPRSASICPGDNIYLQGDYQTNPGIYRDTLATINGCDSILITTLGFYTVYTIPATAMVCPGENIFLQGDYQTVPGIYRDTLATTQGCDSIIETTLTFRPVHTTALSAQICPGANIYLQGDFQTAPGIYRDTISTFQGCDSILLTTLTFYPVPTTAATALICPGEHIFLQGGFQTVPGIYRDTLTSAQGCDSIVQTTLTFYADPTTNVPVEICVGDSILLAGSYQTTPGIYRDTLTSAQGCDSIVFTTLDFHPQPAVPVITQTGLTLNCSIGGMASYAWYLNGTLLDCTGNTCSCSENGLYTVGITDSHGCTSVSAAYNSTGCDLGLEAHTVVPAIRVFPNPTDGLFHVDLGQVYDAVEVHITDLQGREISSTFFVGSQELTLLLDAPAGVYIVTFYIAGDAQAVVRLIKL
jgi:photosystem II stability/assembly factor-like uncharacterized protein